MFIRVKAERPVKVAVIGAGVFGGFHANKYADNQDANLVAVVDMDRERAEAVASRVGARAETDLAAVLGEVDAVSITTPADTHYYLAKQVLEAGVHCLVEKPIALCTEHADELIRIAARRGLILQVGHQERFVLSQFGILSRDQKPIYAECRRAGPFSGRCMDVSVVMDLMIHDLDLVHQVVPGEVSEVSADADFVHGDLADEVSANVTFDCGAEVKLFASRDAQDRERSMRLVYPDGEIFIDFMARTLTNTTPAELTPAFGGEDISGHPAIANDPLGYALGRFVQSVHTGEVPLVTGGQARRAVDTAVKITNAHGGSLLDQAALIA